MTCHSTETHCSNLYPGLEGFLIFQYYIHPDTDWLADNSIFSTLRDAPVDGIFFSANTNTGANFGETIFGSTTYTSADVSDTLDNIRTRNSLGWGKAIHNWLLILTEPTQIDFKNPNDTDRLINNFLVAGQLVKDSKSNGTGIRGICFDNEVYGTPGKWQYSTSAQAGLYTLDQYNAATYDVGYEIGKGLKQIDKETEFFFLNGYILYWIYLQAHGDTQHFRELNPYGLLRPFMNGMYDAFGERYTGGVKNFIVGAEGTYFCKTRTCVDQDMVLQLGENPYNVYTPYADLPRFKGDTIYYDMLTSFAPGIWLSYFEDNVPVYDNTNPSSNYFTPEGLVLGVKNLLPYAKFVWFFQQHAPFYRPLPDSPPGVTLVNSEYTDALDVLRAELGLPSS